MDPICDVRTTEGGDVCYGVRHCKVRSAARAAGLRASAAAAAHQAAPPNQATPPKQINMWNTVRSVLGGTRHRLTIDEMPDPRDLLDLCEGVHIARCEKRLLQETGRDHLPPLPLSLQALLQLTGTELLEGFPGRLVVFD